MIFQQLLPISHYPNCRGEKSKRVVLQEQLDAYLEAYQKSNSNLAQFYDILKNHLGRGSDEAVVLPRNIPIDSIAICPVCRKPMTVNTIPNGTSVVSCTGWPDCKASGFFPRGAWLKNRGSPCQSCPGFYRAVFHFPVGTVPNSTMIGQYQGCLGCDADLKAVINIGKTDRIKLLTGVHPIRPIRDQATLIDLLQIRGKENQVPRFQNYASIRSHFNFQLIPGFSLKLSNTI